MTPVMPRRHPILLGLLLIAGFACASRASAGTIYGSGQRQQSTNPSLPTYSLDANWKVVASPAGPGSPNLVLDPAYLGEGGLYRDPWFGWTATTWDPALSESPTAGFVPPTPATGYSAHIPTQLPALFYGLGGTPDDFTMVNQPGIVVDGISYNWISATPQGDAFFSSPYNQSDYTWIVAQDFYVDLPFFYDFTFQGAGDNAIQFFIDGTVSTALQGPEAAAANGYWSDSVHPTITGGTALKLPDGSTTWGSLHDLGTFTGKGYLTSGTHTAYMVLHDVGGMTAAFISQATFTVSSVPEIDPAGVGSVLAFVTGALGLIERRRPRRATPAHRGRPCPRCR